MIHLSKKWACMIEVTSACGHQCPNCVKHTRHLRIDQIIHMRPTDIISGIETLASYPGKICLSGGDPLLHPEFLEICRQIRRLTALRPATFPKQRFGLFTSDRSRSDKWWGDIEGTFGEFYLNEHTAEQEEVCKHQPIYMSVSDVVPDRAKMWELIMNCWCGDMWSPIITRKGAFFCDVAYGWDALLDGPGGWKVNDNWWDRGFEDYSDQVSRYCHLCGICVPMKQQLLNDKIERVSPRIYKYMKDAKLRNLHLMEAAETIFTPEEIEENRKDWKPWHNRQDRGEGMEGPERVM